MDPPKSFAEALGLLPPIWHQAFNQGQYDALTGKPPDECPYDDPMMIDGWMAGQRHQSLSTTKRRQKSMKKTVKKPDIVEHVADQCGLSQKQALAAVNALIQLIQDEVADGAKVNLHGVGTWEVAIKAARRFKNPRTQEEKDIPERPGVRFTASQALKGKVNYPALKGGACESKLG